MKNIQNKQIISKEKGIKMAIQDEKRKMALIKSDKKFTSKESIQSRFKSLLKKEAIGLFSNIKNYTNSLVCQICKQEIINPKTMSYLQIYPRNKKQFITFHFKCAFKPGTANNFNAIASNFDYIFDIDG